MTKRTKPIETKPAPQYVPTLYKVLDKNGLPQSGGPATFRWNLPTKKAPGEWTTDPRVAESGGVVRCGVGLHLTYDPFEWFHPAPLPQDQDRIFVAEGRGQSDPAPERAVRTRDGKVAFAEARLLREVLPSEFDGLRELLRLREVDAPAVYHSRFNRRGRTYPHTREEAEAILHKAGRRGSKKLARNTYLERDHAGNPAVRFHRTHIVTFLPRGRVRLSTGGWYSVTTKARITECGLCVSSAGSGVWAVSARSSKHPHPAVVFRDGMEFNLATGPSVKRYGKAEDKVREIRREQSRERRAEKKRRAIEAEAEARRIERGEHREYCDKAERTAWCDREGQYKYQPSGLCGCGIVVDPSHLQTLPQGKMFPEVQS